MNPNNIEETLSNAAYKVVWGDYRPTYEFVAEYVPGSMMGDDWDAFEMLEYELIASKVRNQYGFNIPIE